MPSRATEILRFIKLELSPEEVLVFEHLTGDGGKAKLSSGQIAKRLKMSPSKVSRIKKRIEETIERYY